VFFRQRELEVDGGQEGKNVGLQMATKISKNVNTMLKMIVPIPKSAWRLPEYRMKKCVEEKNSTSRK
jgi:hypothetical protein